MKTQFKTMVLLVSVLMLLVYSTGSTSNYPYPVYSPKSPDNQTKALDDGCWVEWQGIYDTESAIPLYEPSTYFAVRQDPAQTGCGFVFDVTTVYITISNPNGEALAFDATPVIFSSELVDPINGVYAPGTILATGSPASIDLDSGFGMTLILPLDEPCRVEGSYFAGVLFEIPSYLNKYLSIAVDDGDDGDDPDSRPGWTYVKAGIGWDDLIDEGYCAGNALLTSYGINVSDYVDLIDSITFEYDIEDEEDTVQYISNIEITNENIIYFNKLVHLLLPSTPIVVNYDGLPSGYSFTVEDIHLIDDTISYEDTEMWKLEENLHQFQVVLDTVGSPTYDTLQKPYYTSCVPLIEAPWATVDDAYFDETNKQYYINVFTPDINGGDVPEWEYNFSIYEYNFDNSVDLGVDIEQIMQLNGDSAVTVDDTLRLKLFNNEVLKYSTDVDANIKSDPCEFEVCHEFPVKSIEPLEVFDKPLGKIPLTQAGQPVIEVNGVIKLGGGMDLELCLGYGMGGYAGVSKVIITPNINPIFGVYGDLEVMGGAATLRGVLLGNTTFYFPVYFNEDNDWVPCIAANIDFNLDYEFWVKAWDTWIKLHEGSKDLFELGPFGCNKKYSGDEATSDKAMRETITPFVEGKFYGSPAMATSGDGTKVMSVFVHDDNGVDKIVFSELGISGEWSDPFPIPTQYGDNAKVDPDIAAYGSSSFAVIWTETDNTIPIPEDKTDVTLFDYARTGDIYVAIYNGDMFSWSPPELISDDADFYADCKPTIAASDDRIFAVWSRNEVDEGELYDPEYQFIYYSVYNFDGSYNWQIPQRILFGSGDYNISPTVAIDYTYAIGNEEAVVVWVCDTLGLEDSPESRILRKANITRGGSCYDFKVVESLPGPYRPSLAINDIYKVVAYETWGYLTDSVGLPILDDYVGWGDNVRIGASVCDDQSDIWVADSIGHNSYAGFGSYPKVVMKDGVAYLTFVGFERPDYAIYDGEIRVTKCNLIEGSPTWTSPLMSTQDDDDYTYPGDIAIDPIGKLRIQFLRDVPVLSYYTYPEGYDQIYELVLSTDLSCCVGIAGDLDDNGTIDISDLTYQVDYMFLGGLEPVCLEEGDVDGSGSITISDLTFQVDYMFQGGDPPVPCGSSGVPTAGKMRGDIILKTMYDDSTTTISIESPVDIRGIQIDFAGDENGSITKLVDEDLEVFFHQKQYKGRIGILDMEGSELIEKGTRELVRLNGNYDVVSAFISDINHITLIPTVIKVTTLPTEFALQQNFPNPFNPVTMMKFALPKAADVRLEVYNILGQQVTTLVDEHLPAGNHQVEWDASNAASGVYFYRIQAAEFTKSRKMLLLK